MGMERFTPFIWLEVRNENRKTITWFRNFSSINRAKSGVYRYAEFDNFDILLYRRNQKYKGKEKWDTPSLGDEHIHSLNI